MTLTLRLWSVDFKGLKNADLEHAIQNVGVNLTEDTLWGLLTHDNHSDQVHS
jgi:hypothetical protein